MQIFKAFRPGLYSPTPIHTFSRRENVKIAQGETLGQRPHPSTPYRRARTNTQYKVPSKAIESQHCIRARLQPCRQSNKIYVGLQPLREDLPEGGGGLNGV